jgi:hypothetical protein
MIILEEKNQKNMRNSKTPKGYRQTLMGNLRAIGKERFNHSSLLSNPQPIYKIFPYLSKNGGISVEKKLETLGSSSPRIFNFSKL